RHLLVPIQPGPSTRRKREPVRAPIRSTSLTLEAPREGMPVLKRVAVLCSAVALTATMASVSVANASDPGANSYRVTRLVSAEPGVAMHTDPNLVNAWGLAAGPTSPWWVADNEKDVSTLYDADGNAIPLIVDVAGAPTGTVFNGTPAFIVKHAGFHGPAVF